MKQNYYLEFHPYASGSIGFIFAAAVGAHYATQNAAFYARLALLVVSIGLIAKLVLTF